MITFWLRTITNIFCFYYGLNLELFSIHKKSIKMKSKILVTLTLIFALGFTSFAQELKTEKIKVYGECGMCEKRIDKAAKSVDGVTKAEWDKETKMLEVTFDTAKTNLEMIQTAVSKVGHDTDATKTDDKTYSSLPGCCKYERPKK